MAATEYGAYTYESKLNFCRSARWIISDTTSPLWPDEPLPKLVRRGTPINVLDHEGAKCGDLDDRLSLVTGDLVHYSPRKGGPDRYVLDRDVYSQSQYRAYAKKSRVNAGKRATHPLLASKAVVLNGLATVPIPAAIAKSGYEGGLLALLNAGGQEALSAGCDVARARRYVEAAGRAFAKRSYETARADAFSGIAYVGGCSDTDMAARVNGDAALLFAKSELRLGMLTAGKNDADLAEADYISCINANAGYSEDDVSWCDAHREESDAISNE